MLIIIGITVVLFSVFGGYVLGGGALGPLYQPMEYLLIVGAGVGAFIASNNGMAIKDTFKAAGKLKRTKGYNRALYMDLMTVLFKILTKMRRDGALGVENDIEDPENSPIFSEYPKIAKDPMIMGFITDYLRLVISGNIEVFELDELMSHEIEVFHHDAHVPVDALTKVGDGLPAFGIIAAVMGVVKALGGEAGEMGEMVAHALVGTFVGILLAYGVVNPIASRIDRQVQEAVRMLQCIRVTLLASLNGYAPQLSVEFGRKALHVDERPSFIELEEHVRAANKSSGNNAA